MSVSDGLWRTFTGSTIPASSDITWTWRKRLPAGHVAFLGGAPGVGKSVLIWALAMSVLVGRPFLDAEVERGDVLVYDFDSEPGAQGHMMDKVRRGLGLTRNDIGDRLVYRVPNAGMPTLTSERLDSVATEIRCGGPALVIVDAWTSALWTVRSNDTESVAAAMTTLRTLAHLGPSILVIDHAPKPVTNGPSIIERGLLGSTMKLAGSRAAYLLTRVAPRDVAGRDVIAMHTLKNNLAPLGEPLGIERTWANDAVTFATADLPEAEVEAPGRMRAMAALREVLDPVDLIRRRDLEELVCKRANVRTRTAEAALSRLIAEGVVEAVPLPEDRRARGYRLSSVVEEMPA